jgi:DNA-binding response OmpR family regulator
MTTKRPQGHLLVIEDHRDIAVTICEALETAGYDVDYAANGVAGLALATAHDFDTIVLDVGLPRIDGLDVCRRIRAQAGAQTPVLFLTARDTLQDKLAGFDAGGDDYLVKPFALEELEARVGVLVRRYRGALPRGVLSVGPLSIDLQTHRLARDGVEIRLSPVGMKLMALLMTRAPALVTRADMEREIWGDRPPDSDALRSHLYSLRKAVDKPFERALIRTIAGVGYRLADD